MVGREPKMTVEQGKDLDEILDQLGGFGKFQIINVALMSIVIGISSIFGVIYIFEAGDATYRCRVPECEAASSDYNQDWLPIAIPKTNSSEYESCLRYTALNSTGVNSCAGRLSDAVSTCSEWIYNDDKETILREDWGLQCEENKWKLNLVGSINNAGQVLGLPLAGFVSDRYGRRTMIVMSGVANACVGIIRSFSTNYYMFLALEFIDPAVGAGLFIAAFVLAVELVAPSHRVLAGTLVTYAFAVGEMILGGLAWWLQSWRTLLLVCYCPALLLIVYQWTVPESFRWLLAQGRRQEAAEVLEKVARVNGVELPAGSLDAVTKEQPKPTKVQGTSSPLIAVFSSKKLILRFINCSFCWITITFVFFGMSINSVEIAGDKYLNFVLSGLIEIPAYFLTYIVMDRYGRKASLAWSLVVCAVANGVVAFIPHDDNWDWAHLVMFLISKFGISISFTAIYVYTSEMFPTTIRQSAMSACSMVAKIAGIATPLTPLLADYFESLPLLLFAALSITSALLVSFFPETLNTVLPDTVEQAEDISAISAKRAPDP